ncbi:DUF6531 domain-containing protein [Streptomyces sp. NPDC047967]|uniref:scabin-related ADP-ribosyltransferase n=1 Tax=Streptomyces sp. NPDC047967 TaxID=3154924 RepID=UPI0033E18514
MPIQEIYDSKGEAVAYYRYRKSGEGISRLAGFRPKDGEEYTFKGEAYYNNDNDGGTDEEEEEGPQDIPVRFHIMCLPSVTTPEGKTLGYIKTEPTTIKGVPSHIHSPSDDANVPKYPGVPISYTYKHDKKLCQEGYEKTMEWGWGAYTPAAYFFQAQGLSTRGVFEDFSFEGSYYGLAHETIPDNQTYGNLCNGNSASVSHCQSIRGIGINTSTGAYGGSFNDAALGGSDPINLTRSYSSKNGKVGILGSGWSTPWEASLNIQGDGKISFLAEDGSEYLFIKNEKGYSAPNYSKSNLTETSSGYSLKTRTGETLQFSPTGNLTKSSSKQNRSTTYERNPGGTISSVTSQNGNKAKFFYADSRLKRIELSDSRVVSYDYTEGKLTKIEGPNGVVGYTYDGSGRLDSVIDQRKNVAVKNYYDSSGRVERQVDAAGESTLFSYSGEETDVTAPDGGIWTDIHSANVLKAQYDPFGNKTEYSYSFGVDPVQQVDALGRTFTTAFDGKGRTTSIRTPLSSNGWAYHPDGNVSWHQNGNGKTSYYKYHPDGSLYTVTDPLGKNQSFTYTPSGKLEKHTDPRQKSTTFEYDAAGNQTKVVYPDKTVLTRSYDKFGRVDTLTDARGNLDGADPADFTTRFTYDEAGRVRTTTDPKGNVTENTYDAAGNLETVTDAERKVTTYAYDEANRLIQITDPAGNSTITQYDKLGNIASRTDANGSKTTYTYDKAGRLATMTTPRGNVKDANPAAYTWKYGYDKVGNQTTVTDPFGKTTKTEYDGENRPFRVTDPLGRSNEVEYDGEGNIVTETDALEKTTVNTYDDNGRLTSVEDRDGKTRRYGYDESGNLTSETSPLGHRTTYAYDDNDRLSSQVDPRGNVSGANPTQFTWHTGYDAVGNLTSEKDPLGHEATSTYDALNNLTESIDRNGKKTRYEYDTLKRTKKITAPDGGTTDLSYDVSGRVSSRTDSNQKINTYEYDKVGRLVKLTDPLKRATTYEYDSDGNRKKVTNARGQTITTSYDGRNLPGTVTYSDGTPKVTYTYYDDGMPRTIADGTGTRTLTYDNERRPLSISQPGVAQPFKYTYRAGGSISSRTYPDGRATTFMYDDDTRVKSQTTNAKTTTYTWDPANNLTTTKFPTTAVRTETRTYDRAGRIDSASEGAGARHFTRDANGRVISDTYKDLTSTRPTTRYAYDDTGRLTRNCTDSSSTSCLSGTTGETYTYDKVGNRKTTVSASGTTTDSHDAANQLIKRVAGATTTTMTYDADGNLTKDATGTYTYTAEGQVKTATVGTNTYTFGYDADGNRTTAAVNGTASRITTWDVNNPLPQIATDRSAANVLVGDYQYNPLGIAQQMDTPKGSFYLQHDRQGSVTNVYDAAGTETYKYTYSPWGTTTGTASTTGGQISLFGYTGQYKNPYIPNQLDLRARTYSSSAGRFTTTDPEPTEPGDPNSSPYAYANNDPINQSDPSGRCPLCVSAGIGALIGGAIEGGIYGWQHRNDANFSWQGLAGATARGAVTGAVAGALMPGVGNAVSRGLGLSGLRSLGASTAVNAGVGAGFAWGVNQVHCRPTDPWDLIFGASGGAASSLTGPAFSWLRGLKGKTPATNPFPHISAPAKSIVFPKRVFRGDSRSPEEIFANGFKAEPMKAPFDLQQYGWYNTGSASVIGTSKKANLAMQFPQKAKGSTWVYEIAHPGAGIDMNKALGMKYIFTSEKEIIFPGGILPSQIVRAVRWSWGSPTKQVVENPGYSP